MNITLITSWYDEKSDWLYELVCSTAGICSHVVAVDGAYALYPDAKGRSSGAQADAISRAARKCDIGLTLHHPAGPWTGNEVEKRDVMFQLAALTRPDWMLILDGDERVLESPDDLHGILEGTAESVVAVSHHLTDGRVGRCRKLYRPPLRVGSFHAEYLDRRGVDLAATDECLFLESMVVEHKRERPVGRQQAAATYYRRRDEAGIEAR